jgi:hypothetical protein
VGIIHCQDHAPILADIEPRQDGDVHVDLSVIDSPSELDDDPNNLAGDGGLVTRIILTTTPTPEPFSCHECRNCNSKSDFVTRVCETGMCYVCLLYISLIVCSFVFFFCSIENA